MGVGTRVSVRRSLNNVLKPGADLIYNPTPWLNSIMSFFPPSSFLEGKRRLRNDISIRRRRRRVDELKLRLYSVQGVQAGTPPPPHVSPDRKFVFLVAIIGTNERRRPTASRDPSPRDGGRQEAACVAPYIIITAPAKRRVTRLPVTLSGAGAI